ncbi:hypothetical protein T4C_4300 [Trichinella pseudospiralis]|uniref:Uncharacterized protein n=1 Tax=Trichinella pseudospiralis TaxID=6337 RepID=A0A0V1K1A8_TRIPS|nr:hypothetical protein T4C_4300 [Trichinella pseudospiralis]
MFELKSLPRILRTDAAFVKAAASCQSFIGYFSRFHSKWQMTKSVPACLPKSTTLDLTIFMINNNIKNRNMLLLLKLFIIENDTLLFAGQRFDKRESDCCSQVRTVRAWAANATSRQSASAVAADSSV